MKQETITAIIITIFGAIILALLTIHILNTFSTQIYTTCCEQLGGVMEVYALDCSIAPSDCAKCSIEDLTMCEINLVNGK